MGGKSSKECVRLVASRSGFHHQRRNKTDTGRWTAPVAVQEPDVIWRAPVEKKRNERNQECSILTDEPTLGMSIPLTSRL